MSDDDFAATTCTCSLVEESFHFFFYSTVVLLLFKSTGPAPFKTENSGIQLYILVQLQTNNDIIHMCYYIASVRPKLHM